MTKSKKLTNTKSVKREALINELNNLEDKHGVIKPRHVVDIAQNPNSLLHDYFTWDDSKAGDRYRLMEARILITKVRVEWQGEKRDAYFNVKVNEKDRGYVSREVIVSDDQMRQQVLRYALSQLQHWRNTYNEMQELSGIIDEEKMEDLKEELEDNS